MSQTFALDGGGWSMPRPSHFTPGKATVPTVNFIVLIADILAGGKNSSCN
jgi:hypothetical protein